jgi:hypothetical protein
MFINQRGYNHLYHRHLHRHQQHCRKTNAFPSKIPPPRNDVGQQRAGGGANRTSVVASPLPPNRNNVWVPSSFGVAPPMTNAVVGGCHCSLVIVPLLQTIAIIILVLLLLPKRTPILDRETHLRATYDNIGSLVSNHPSGLSSLLARGPGQPPLIHPLPPSAPRRNPQRNLRNV